MPFAAVLTGGLLTFLSPPDAVSPHGRAYLRSALCPLTMLRHVANLQAPNALRQGIPFFLLELSSWSPRLRL